MKAALYSQFVHGLLCLFPAAAAADHPTVIFGTGGGGPITTITASPMPVGSWSFGIQTEIIENETFTNDELEHAVEIRNQSIHSIKLLTSSSFSASYGISEDLDVSFRVPYIDRENIKAGEIEHGKPETHSHGNSSGFGDLSLFGRYRFYQNNTTDVSMNFGIKVPTGEVTEKDDQGDRFETEFQPGTGSVDLLIGASFSMSSGSFGYHGNVLFNRTSEGAQSTEIGDSLSYNTAVTWRLNNHNLTLHDHNHGEFEHSETQWDLMLEMNGVSMRKTRVATISQRSSGGTTLFLSPGLKVTLGKFNAFATFSIPLIQNKNGNQENIEKRMIAGVSFAL
jgi:hypothetical protein